MLGLWWGQVILVSLRHFVGLCLHSYEFEFGSGLIALSRIVLPCCDRVFCLLVIITHVT